MPSITIDIETKLKTTDSFLKSILSGLAGEVNDQVTIFLEEEAKEMAKGAEIYPVPESIEQRNRIESSSGYLSDTIFSKTKTKTKYSATSEVKARANHASWVEYGTGMHGELEAPHMIKPKSASVMSWIGSNGERIFAASTAGQYPKPFMRGPIFKLKATISKVLGFNNSKVKNVPSTQSQISGKSGLNKLNMGVQNQLNTNPQTSTKMWDQSLRSQVKRKQ